MSPYRNVDVHVGAILTETGGSPTCAQHHLNTNKQLGPTSELKQNTSWVLQAFEWISSAPFSLLELFGAKPPGSWRV